MTTTAVLSIVTVAGTVAPVATSVSVEVLSRHRLRTIAGISTDTVPAATAVTVCVAPGTAAPSLKRVTVYAPAAVPAAVDGVSTVLDGSAV